MDRNDAEAVIRETIEYANKEIRRSKARMRRTVFISVIVIIAFILFFPFSNTRIYSGDGSVLNSDKEPIDNCAIMIEIEEWKSLVFRYKMDFTFILNGTKCYASDESDFSAWFSVSECGDIIISQPYYDAGSNTMKPCSLFYRAEDSYTEVSYGGNCYTLGTE